MDLNDLRRRAVEAAQGVKWLPAWGEGRFINMVESRPDWCISRQRVWGVPIIAFYCEACNEPMTDPAKLRLVVEQFREHTADVWYTKSPAELLGEEDARCPNAVMVNCARRTTSSTCGSIPGPATWPS